MNTFISSLNSGRRPMQFNQRTTAGNTLSLCTLIFALLFSSFSFGQTSTWVGTNTTWLTAGNWTPSGAPSGTSAEAFFNNTSSLGMGINMNGISAANSSIGAIHYGPSNTSVRTLNNSSTTVPGTLTINGITLNSIPNTIIRNNSSATNTINNGASQALNIGLGNATNNVILIDGTGGLTITSVISGASRKLTKDGSGTGILTLTGLNTYSGGTTVTAGEIRFNPTANLTLAGNFTLNGGNLGTTGITANRTLTFANLVLTDNSIISLASATAHRLTFTTAGAFSAGKTITINGWKGTAGNTGTQGKIFIGSNASGLTAAQLSQITFTDFTGGSTLLATGELVPAVVSSGFTSTKSGPWSDTATWGGVGVPTSADNAVIASGHVVTMDSDTYATRNSGTTTVVNAGGILATSKTYVNNGTTTVNGSFQLESGSWVTSASGINDLVYGSNGTLIFNTAYSANSGNYWPTSSGPVNVTVNTSSNLDLGFARTVTGLFQTSSNINNPGNITIGTNGTLKLNGGYNWSGSGSPVYGANSLLLYNSTGSPGRGVEWNQSSGTIGTTPGYPNNVQISNNTTLNFANGSSSTFKADKTVLIDSGSALYQNYGSGNAGLIVGTDLTVNGNLTLGTSSGDVTVGGNFTVASTGFNSFGRAVIFNGSANQTITRTTPGTLDFDYITINKSGGNVVLSASPATDINLNATTGDFLRIISTGGFDLNGRSMSLNNNGGGIYVDGARSITSTVAGGKIEVNQYKRVSNNSGTGTLTLDANVTVNLNTNGNFDFGKSGSTYITTLNGTLSINSTTNCFVNTNPPIYGSASLLKYNSGGTSYGRGVEWSTTSGAGFPNDIQVTNNTTLDVPNTGGAFSTNLALARDLTIDSGSALYMDYGAGAASGSLTVGRNVNIAGALSLGDAFGGDMNVAGNWTRTGTFTPNGRAVTFNGTLAQTLTGATTFDYLTLNNTAATNPGLTLQAASAVTVNQTLALTAGKLTLGANDLTIESAGTITGGSASSYIITNGIGQLKRTVGATAINFTVGSATLYNPIILSNSGTSDIFGIKLTAGTVPAVNDATATVNDRWLISEAVSGGSTLVVTPQWNTADQGSSFASGSQLYVGFYDGTDWTQNAATLSGTNPYTAIGAATFAPTTLSGTQYFAVGKDSAFKCGVLPIPFSQNFDSVSTPALPSCWKIEDVNGDGTKWSTDTINSSSSPNSLVYSWNTNNAANDWAYTPGLNLTAGTAYRISFKYAVGGSTFPEKLKIGYGTVAAAASMTTLADLGSLTNTAYNTGNYDFVPSVSGTYYIGFNAYSDKNMYYLSIDDVSVTIAPPTLLVNNLSSATLAFGNQEIGAAVSPQSFILSGANLTGYPNNITITSPSTDYQVSSDGGVTFGSSATVAYTSATLANQNIFVKYIPSTCGVSSTGNISFSGGGVTISPTVAVSGTAILANPTSVAATDITDTSFTANWNVVTGATGYELEVSKSPTFGTSSAGTLTEGFNGGTTAPSGWVFTTIGATYTSAGNFGVTAPSLSFDATADRVLTPILSGLATELKFWIKGQGTTTTSALLVEGYNGISWVQIENITNSIPTTGTTYTYNSSSPIVLPANLTQFRFTYTKSIGNLAFDDVAIIYNSSTPDFVTGYAPKIISGGSTISSSVTGLEADTQYYYRVRAVSGTCKSANSNVISVLTDNKVTWNGTAWSNITGPTSNLEAIIKGPFVTGAAPQNDFTAKKLTIATGGSVQITAGRYIKVVNELNNMLDESKFVVESDGNFWQTTSATNTGSITVKREITRRDGNQYNYLISPTVGSNLKTDIYGTGNSSQFTLYHNEVNNTFSNSSGAYIRGRGLAVKEPASGSASSTAIFKGVPMNEAFTYNLANSNVGEGITLGYNLTGNPYPSNIDLVKLYNLNSNENKISSTFYFWDNTVNSRTAQSGSGYNGEAYAIFNAASGTYGTGKGAGYLTGSSEAAKVPTYVGKVGQGFMVQSKERVVKTLDFDNTIRNADSGVGFFGNATKGGSLPEDDRFWLNLSAPTNITNQVAIVYFEAGLNEFAQDDSELKSLSSDILYTLIGDKKAVINGRSSFVNSDSIPLGSNSFTAGTFTFSLGNKEGKFANGQNIYLKDKQTGIVTNLSEGNYTFTANAGESTGRFEIIYQPETVLATDTKVKENLIVYKDGNDFVVKAQNKKISSLEVFDSAGRLIWALKPENIKAIIPAEKINNGFYVLKINQNGEITSKKIIR